MTGAKDFRVAMIASNFHPYVGGAERQAFELSKELQLLGVKAIVLTRLHQGLVARESLDGVEVRRLRAAGPGLIGVLAFMVSLFAWLWENSSEWEVAHVHLAGSQALPAALAGKLLMRRVIVKVGGGRGIGEIALSSKTFLGSLKLKVLRALGTRFVAVTEDLAKEAREHGIDGAIQVIPNGVDTRRFRSVDAERKHELRQSWGWPAQAFCLLYVGRLAVEKRLDILIRGLAEIRRDSGTDVFFAMAGTGPERARLEVAAREEGIEDRVRFHSPVESVERLYQAADVFVLPSISEGLSNALLEAMSCGLPVVASRVGGSAEAVEDGVSGILFDPNDITGMKRGIERLARTPEEAEAMARRARESVSACYAIRGVAERYLNLYRN